VFVLINQKNKTNHRAFEYTSQKKKVGVFFFCVLKKEKEEKFLRARRGKKGKQKHLSSINNAFHKRWEQLTK